MVNKGRVIVAMSGGVDSSVAALLLKEQGFDVIGVTMRLWTVERDDLPTLSKRCCSVEDVKDARRVCQTIDAPHYVLNFEREFQKHVVDYFCQEYDRGRTPHPCLACNDKIKFDFLLRRAMFLEADYIATGHYARIRANGDRLALLKGADANKDQSYILFTLTQAELRRLRLPIGEHPKKRIRQIAAEAGLPVADKPDSQEICFIPDGDYRKFVGDRTRPRPGVLVDSNGAVLGHHPGVQFFTIGQRRGLGLPGNTGSPMYVVGIDAHTSRVTLGPEDGLYRSSLWASRVNFISGAAPPGPIEVTAKVRYKASGASATMTATDGWAEIRFDEPQRAVTPGQAVVFYKGEEVVGGGIIELEPPGSWHSGGSGHEEDPATSVGLPRGEAAALPAQP